MVLSFPFDHRVNDGCPVAEMLDWLSDFKHDYRHTHRISILGKSCASICHGFSAASNAIAWTFHMAGLPHQIQYLDNFHETIRFLQGSLIH